MSDGQDTERSQRASQKQAVRTRTLGCPPPRVSCFRSQTGSCRRLAGREKILPSCLNFSERIHARVKRLRQVVLVVRGLFHSAVYLALRLFSFATTRWCAILRNRFRPMRAMRPTHTLRVQSVSEGTCLALLKATLCMAHVLAYHAVSVCQRCVRGCYVCVTLSVYNRQPDVDLTKTVPSRSNSVHFSDPRYEYECSGKGNNVGYTLGRSSSVPGSVILDSCVYLDGRSAGGKPIILTLSCVNAE